jgi:hypothetical protein
VGHAERHIPANLPTFCLCHGLILNRFYLGPGYFRPVYLSAFIT